MPKITSGPPESGGGSQPVSNSYLYSNAAGFVSAPSGGAIPVDYPPDAVAGTDISLSSDGKTITINTTGWYWLMSQIVGAPTDNAGIGTLLFFLSGSFADNPLAAMTIEWSMFVNGPVSTDPQRAMLTLAPIHILAGDQLVIAATESMAAGHSKASCDLTVVRMF